MGSSLQLIHRARQLQRLRAERLDLLRARRRRSTKIPDRILDYIPWANPGWVSPTHLVSLAEDMERAFGGEELARYHTVPPRHAKSETLLNGLSWGLRQRPDTPILYATHTATFAHKQSKRVKRLFCDAGGQLERGSNRSDEWETTAGGGLVARGIGGEITGRGFRIIIIDDPFKSRALAEVPTYRQRVWEWLRDDVFTRGTPDACYIVVHTRWMPDDPIGRLIKEGWEGTVLRAVAEEDDPIGRAPGEALAPELGWTRERLDERRHLVGEYGWASLFQCRPRPRGGKVFGPPSFYRELPAHVRRAYGVDLAYSAKSSADHSVVVEMLRETAEPRYYIPWALSVQERQTRFAKRLKARQTKARAPMLFLAGGTELGAADFISENVPRFEVEPATADKFVRAQRFAADWNAGKVLMPDPDAFEDVDLEWLPEFLDVLDSFTGVKDTRDDEVDAAVAAHRKLDTSTSSSILAYM